MRADAQRKYNRILEVAEDVFATQGTEASLNEIAKRAGVGPGTLYRHFPTRENLIDACMKNWADRIEAAADETAALNLPPRDLLVAWFEEFVTHISLHRGGPARLIAAMEIPESPMYGKLQILERANARVLDRLAAEGVLRDGIDTIQVCRLVGGVAAVADQGSLDMEVVRPLLGIVADGLLRTEGGSNAGN